MLKDKTRPPGKPPLSAETVAKVLALPCSEPPGEATHWTGRAVARAVGVSLRAVQRLWQAHDLQPHRIRTFKKSNDPAFAEKVEDIVGLYMNPPAHAVVLSIDEAGPLHQRSLAIREKVLGPEHPDVAQSLENYADLLKAIGLRAEAARMEARAKAILAKSE